MPTYILHGGRTSLDSSSNEAFYAAMASRIPEGGTWLGCYFSRLAESEAEKFAADSKKMKQAAPHKINLALATADNFLEQLKTAHVLYFAGGSTQGLFNQLAMWPDIKTHLATVPVIVGSSAGMIMLGLGGINRKGEHYTGLGLIPFHMRVHHGHPDFALADATQLPNPILALQETQFCVITSNH